MRTLLTLLLIVCGSFIFSFQCYATTPVSLFSTYDEDEYWEFIEESDLPDDFVTYDDISFIGPFGKFHLNEYGRFPTFDSYSYGFISSEEDSFDETDIKGYLTVDSSGISFQQESRHRIEIDPSMDLRYCATDEASYCRVGDLYYFYNGGKLTRVCWYDSSSSKTVRLLVFVRNLSLSDEGFFEKLLNIETSEECGKQLISAVTGKVRSSWPWVGIGGGAAVVIGGAVATALILRKKRRRAVAVRLLQ